MKALLLLLMTLVSLQASEPTIRSILDAKPAERHRLFTKLAKQRTAIVAPANRPPVTPGNEHGKRPAVPPGLRKYGTP